MHPDRDAEERRHGGMVRGEPEALRAGGDIGEPERPVLGDQGAQHAPAGGAGADGPLFLVAQADRQELVQRPAVLGQDPERPVLRVDDVAGLLADPPKHHREVQLGIEDEDRLHQSAQPGGIVDPVEGLHGQSG